MRTINRAVVVGNVTGSPSFRESGERSVPTAEFVVATNRGEGATRETEYHQVLAFGRLAVQCASVEKGAAVYVEGRMATKEGGQTEIIAHEVVFLPQTVQ